MIGPRKGEKVVPHRVIGVIPLHSETLFAALDMAGKGAVGKAEDVHWAGIVNDVHNAAGIQNPDTPHVSQGQRRWCQPRSVLPVSIVVANQG